VWDTDIYLSLPGSRDQVVALLAEQGYVNFRHRDDFNILTNRQQNDLFVRKDIVEKYHVVQLD
jgi:hypothetical protein